MTVIAFIAFIALMSVAGWLTGDLLWKISHLDETKRKNKTR